MADVEDGAKEVATFATARGFVESLWTDRMLDIYIGKASVPLKVPESMLVSMSDVFAEAVRLERLGGRPLGTLGFPDDDGVAWVSLLWWKTRGDFIGLGIHSNVQAWIMGDKYGIKGFQDDLMLVIIVCLETHVLELETAKHVFANTAQGSPLRILMAEEIADQVRKVDGGIAIQEILAAFDGVAGFAAEMIQALETFENCGRDKLKKERSKLHLARFMVGDGSRRRSLR